MDLPVRFARVDEPSLIDCDWLVSQREAARFELAEHAVKLFACQQFKNSLKRVILYSENSDKRISRWPNSIQGHGIYTERMMH